MSWKRKKENYISQSTTKAKYVVATVNSSNIMWLKKLLKCMKEEITNLVVIYCNNTSSINISKNPVMHTKIKHIAIKYHYLREVVQDRSEARICAHKGINC